MNPKPESMLIQAGVLLPLGSESETLFDQDILVENGTISSVGPRAAHTDRVVESTIDAKDKLVIPGLINAHTHSPAALFKGSFDILDHPRFMWRNQAETANRSAEEIYTATLFAAMEMIRYGTTAVIDNYPEQNFEAEDVAPAIRAYRDIGMRVGLALRLFDGPYEDIYPRDLSMVPAEVRHLLESGPLSPRESDELLAMAENIVVKWHNKDRGLVDIMVASSNPLRCSEKLLLGLARISERFDIGYHMHLLETPVQEEIAQRRFGSRIVPYLNSLGIVNSRLSCAHCIWFEKQDIEIFADKGATVIHNPVSNLRLGDGIAPVIDMIRAGVNVGLGTDGLTTNDNASLFEEIKLASILHRCSGHPMESWISDREALDMATKGGAQALLQGQTVGSIEIGKRADLVVVRLDTPSFTPLNNPQHQLVYCENGSSVDTVIIDGKIVFRDGRFIDIDDLDVVTRVRKLPETIRVRNRWLYDLSDRINDYLD